MNNRRKLVVALGASALVSPLSPHAQPQTKVWRIGFLGSENPSGYKTRVEALRAGLRDFGYVEGKNLVIEFRWAEGKLDRLPELAAELVRLNFDVLVTHATSGTRAAKQATTTIPIVVATMADPVATGLVASLARPGGNITGSTFFPVELAAKRIEVLKDALPRITQVAVLDYPSPTSETFINAMETTARSLKVTLHKFAVQEPRELDSAFAAIVKKRINAVAVNEQPIFIANSKAIAELATKYRLPLIGTSEFADAGGVIGYGADLVNLFRRVGFFVDKIFKGTKPGVIPIEQPTRFDLVINMKTAKTLGIKFPQTFLQRAERLIE